MCADSDRPLLSMYIYIHLYVYIYIHIHISFVFLGGAVGGGLAVARSRFHVCS